MAASLTLGGSGRISHRAPRLAGVRRAFLALAEASASRLDSGRQMIDLKRDHSLRVMALAHRILTAHGLEPYELGMVAALLHDVGRFPQFERFRTFRDAESVDHGAEGERLLAASDLLVAFDAAEQAVIRQVVAVHNRRHLPPLSPAVERLAHVVRDADKLDIVRVVLAALESGPVDPTVTLGLRTEPGLSPAVLAALARGETPDYGQLAFVDDFKLFLAAWSQCLRFSESRRIFAARGYLGRLRALLPAHPTVEALFASWAAAL